MTSTCSETRRQLRGTEILSDGALEHLAQCSLCQDMVALLSTAADAPMAHTAHHAETLPNLLRQTEQRIATERGILSWLRSRPTAIRIGMGASLMLIPAALQLAFLPRSDLALYPLPRLLLASGAGVLAAAYGTQLLLRPLYRASAIRPTGITTVIAFALPFALAAMAPAYPIETAFPENWQHVSLPQAGACLRYGALLALPAVVLLVAMDRQLARSRLFLLLAAGLGGVAGNLALLMHCANEQPLHQLLGHATVGLLLLAFTGIFVRVLRR